VDQNTVIVVLGVAAVLAVGLMMRGKQRDDEDSPASKPEDSVSEGASPEPEDYGAESGDDWGEDEWDEDEVVAVTSDGYAFLPDRHAVRLLPPDEEGEAWKAGQRTASHARGQKALDMSWHAGDFTGARVKRGGGEEPWRLEALGRDGEYAVFGFETEEAARAALQLFESRGVVRLGEDEDGNPVPPSPEQFDEARRIYEETEQALAMEPGPDDEERGA
jgi:hypothetical protein